MDEGALGILAYEHEQSCYDLKSGCLLIKFKNIVSKLAYLKELAVFFCYHCRGGGFSIYGIKCAINRF